MNQKFEPPIVQINSFKDRRQYEKKNIRSTSVDLNKIEKGLLMGKKIRRP